MVQRHALRGGQPQNPRCGTTAAFAAVQHFKTGSLYAFAEKSSLGVDRAAQRLV